MPLEKELSPEAILAQFQRAPQGMASAEYQMSPWEAIVAQLAENKSAAQQAEEQKLRAQMAASQETATAAPAGSAVPASGEDMVRAIMGRYTRAAEDRIKDMGLTTQNLQDYRDLAQSQPMKADVSPFLGFLSTMGGGAKNLAQTYKRPESPEERAQRMFELEQGIGKSKQATAEESLKLLKERLDAEMGLMRAKESPFDWKKEVFGQQTRQNILKSDQYQKLEALNDLNGKLDNYNSLVKKYGTKMTGQARQLLDQAKSDLDIAYKEAARLGALTGPDMTIIGKALPDVTGLAGIGQGALRGGAPGALAALKQAKKALASSANIHTQSLSKGFPGYEDVYMPMSMNLTASAEAEERRELDELRKKATE